MFALLKKIPKFTRLLNMDAEGGEKNFLTVSEKDEEFLRSILTDGVMRVSYIHRANSGKIDKLIGPLESYEKWITKLDIPHRRAIVEADVFGKRRTIKFGLWTDADPLTPWLRKLRQMENTVDSNATKDIGIYIGDHVIDKNGIYDGMELYVTGIDATRRIVWVETELFGTKVKIEMDADGVQVSGNIT